MRRLADAVIPADILPHLSSGDLPVEFVLDDYAMAFPVEALPCGDGFLGEAVSVSRRWLCDSFPRHSANVFGTVEMLVVADPSGTHPEARREGRDILRLMRGAAPDWNIRYLSTRVSAADLDNELPNTSLFHIAAHMESDPPGIRMADALWLPRLGSSPPGIVVASCCRSGGLAGGGRAMAGAFLRAGTAQVVAPATVVEDGVAAAFSLRLYQAVARGCGLAEAVHQARAATGLAGLSFIQYGAVGTRPLLDITPEAVTGAGRRHMTLAIVIMLAALVVVGWFLMRNSAPGEQSLPQSPPSSVSAAAADADVPATGKTPVTEAAAPEHEAAGTVDASDPARDAGRRTSVRGGPRVSEKMLENF